MIITIHISIYICIYHRVSGFPSGFIYELSWQECCIFQNKCRWRIHRYEQYLFYHNPCHFNCQYILHISKWCQSMIIHIRICSPACSAKVCVRHQTANLCVFSCDQAALWMVQSVRPSVCLSVRLSVCHTFLTMFPSSYHHQIFRSYYQWQKWRPCKRSEVKGQGHRGHNPT